MGNNMGNNMNEYRINIYVYGEFLESVIITAKSEDEALDIAHTHAPDLVGTTPFEKMYWKRSQPKALNDTIILEVVSTK